MDTTKQQAETFLQILCDAVDGNTEEQVSMYAIGEQLGLEKDEASALAQDLIIDELVELKSLSGAIGITAKGLAGLFGNGGSDPQSGASVTLGTAPVINTDKKTALQSVLAKIQADIAATETEYTHLEELVIDMKTIEVHLLSPRPRTAVIRQVLHSMAETLHSAGLTSASNLARALANEST